MHACSRRHYLHDIPGGFAPKEGNSHSYRPRRRRPVGTYLGWCEPRYFQVMLARSLGDSRTPHTSLAGDPGHQERQFSRTDPTVDVRLALAQAHSWPLEPPPRSFQAMLEPRLLVNSPTPDTTGRFTSRDVERKLSSSKSNCDRPRAHDAGTVVSLSERIARCRESRCGRQVLLRSAYNSRTYSASICPRWERARRCALERAGARGARWRAGDASRFAASRSIAIFRIFSSYRWHLARAPPHRLLRVGKRQEALGCLSGIWTHLGILAILILILILILPDLRSALCRREQMGRR